MVSPQPELAVSAGRLLRVSEVSDEFGVDRVTVWRWVEKGVLPHVRFGPTKRIRVWESDAARVCGSGGQAAPVSSGAYRRVGTVAMDPDVAAAVRCLDKLISPGEGYIYFVQTHDRRFLKIGWSRFLASRLRALQGAHPESLWFIGVIKARSSDERRWHREWRRLRSNGEWFLCDEALLSAVAVALDAVGGTRLTATNFCCTSQERSTAA